MLEITAAAPLQGRCVRLTLSDGSVIERDITDLLRGPVFEAIARDEDAFRRLFVRYGTLVWPGDADIAPETLIWDGPYPEGEAARCPEPFIRLHLPSG
jgi:hypothetical protein